MGVKQNVDLAFLPMAERFNVLIGDDYKPLGGQWMFELGKNSDRF